MRDVTVHGEEVPALGYGTWMLEGPDCRNGVERALELGYRHIDTAQAYGNEAEVGEALRATAVDRGDIFLTTKVWNDNLAHDDVIRSTEESLRKLGTDYVDLLLIHWPVRLDILEESLSAMGDLRDRGRVRHIGVSNFAPSQVERALDHTPIFCNQVEYHPYLSQQALRQLAGKHDFMLTAYSPLAHGEILQDRVLGEIAETHGKSRAQIVLRWLVDQDHVSAIPKATSAEHIRANIDIFDFELSDEERNWIADLDQSRRVIDPFHLDWER
jgi:2,5-diketo-D-gluconate reductase B